jgi:RNA polymerase sporulation-specific sigma factor
LNTEEKNKLAEENLGLVYLVVNKEFTYEKTTESDRENYIEEGMIGLAKAINTFNPSKGAKFSTYAYICIKSEINCYVAKQKTLKRKVEYTCKNSIDDYIEDEEGLTFKDLMIYEKDDYTSKVDLEHLLKVLKKIEIEIYDIRKIIIKKSEGYKNIEIAKMIGVEKNTIKHRIDKAKIKLIELGITA